LGWNVTAGGFHKDQICDYVGGMVPFARTEADRLATNDPRPSLQARYGNLDGYVAAVQKAADNAVAQGFLLPVDATALVKAAQASAVLKGLPAVAPVVAPVPASATPAPAPRPIPTRVPVPEPT
jgi:Alpha/beta hydrolase domain